MLNSGQPPQPAAGVLYQMGSGQLYKLLLTPETMEEICSVFTDSVFTDSLLDSISAGSIAYCMMGHENMFGFNDNT